MAARLHPLATHFSDVADLYEAVRPGYPDTLAELLRVRLQAGSGVRALDAGAGTGKLTRILLATGADVRAAEPVDGMADACERVLDAGRVLRAPAEDLPVEDAELDLVVCGDAFHWFDGERAVTELARVLRPGGGLLIAQHAPFPGERGTWRAELQELLRSVRGEHPFYRKENGRAAFAKRKEFAPLVGVRLDHHHEVDRGGLVDHVRSMCTVAALERERWEEVVAAARRITESAPPRISMSYAIDVWITRRR